MSRRTVSPRSPPAPPRRERRTSRQAGRSISISAAPAIRPAPGARRPLPGSAAQVLSTSCGESRSSNVSRRFELSRAASLQMRIEQQHAAGPLAGKGDDLIDRRCAGRIANPRSHDHAAGRVSSRTDGGPPIRVDGAGQAPFTNSTRGRRVAISVHQFAQGGAHGTSAGNRCDDRGNRGIVARGRAPPWAGSLTSISGAALQGDLRPRRRCRRSTAVPSCRVVHFEETKPAGKGSKRQQFRFREDEAVQTGRLEPARLVEVLLPVLDEILQGRVRHAAAQLHRRRRCRPAAPPRPANARAPTPTPRDAHRQHERRGSGCGRGGRWASVAPRMVFIP